MENDKIKVLALFGKSGAGKDTIKNWLVRTQDMHNIIPCTTRPPRENEVDGKDYFFISKEDFGIRYAMGNFLEATSFNDWNYGTLMNSLRKDKINVGVFNIFGLEQLVEQPGVDVLPVYIKCSDRIRLQRCLNRNLRVDCYEVCRRYLADEEDFENRDIPFDYISYDNSDDDGDIGILNIPSVKIFCTDYNIDYNILLGKLLSLSSQVKDINN